MFWHQLALNVPLERLFTYSHSEVLPLGTRVVVTFRNKRHVAVVWAHTDELDFDANKVLPILEVLQDTPPLSEEWRAMMAFCSRYYLYPIGATVFTALPQGLRNSEALSLPEPKRWYRFNDLGKHSAPEPASRHFKKQALWQALQTEQLSLAELKQIHPQAGKLLQEYEAQQWLDISAQPSHVGFHSDFVLNAEQQHAQAAIVAKLGGFQAFLLHGITGSGKTEVYFAAMAEVLARGQQVLMLLPEINLTPQLLARINSRFFGYEPAVLHSQAAVGARSHDFVRAMKGEAKLIIGTRLSVLTPMPNLGLIVVDEEHDGSFKQQNELRYHARDVALWRAKQAGCPIVLGSATPSLESWNNASTGRFALLSLPERANAQAVLPKIHVIDVRQLPLEEGMCEPVKQALLKNWQQGGMSLVYLNRRGFAPVLACTACGHTFDCPNCSAKMVWHQNQRQLRCHHCDLREPVPVFCPECHNSDLTPLGQGTQRVEEALKALMPHANIVRVDRDTTSGKQDWQQLYEQVQADAVDVLIGTQMLAKGHDFAKLNLVVILNADGALYSSDFRAPEHLFAQLLQVSGRAGRAEQKGKVLLQTQLPDHPLFAALQQHDYISFAEQELASRQLYEFPPFSHMLAVRVDAPQMLEAQQLLQQVLDELALPDDVSVFGPVPMLMARLNGRERAQVFVQSPSRQSLHKAGRLFQAALSAILPHQSAWRYALDMDVQDA